MPARTSKETSDREKACRFVLAAFFQPDHSIAARAASPSTVARRSG